MADRLEDPVSDPVCLADFEDYARKHLPKHAFEFFAGGANDEHTLRENLEAFKRYDYKPSIISMRVVS